MLRILAESTSPSVGGCRIESNRRALLAERPVGPLRLVVVRLYPPR